MLGALRGRIATMDQRFTRTQTCFKARWWKAQYRGIVGFLAAFIGINASILQSVGIVSNTAARQIGCLHGRDNSKGLFRIKREHSICVQEFVARTIVMWVGHCFRHCSHPISQLLSLPLDERLRTLRSRGSGSEVSQSALASFLTFISVGLEVDYPIAGRPSVRGASGFAFHWGEGWFWQIRDGEVG